jgi:phosphate acetyltransferase
MTVLERIYDKARQSKKTIVLPEGPEPRVLRAARSIADKGLAAPVLLGNTYEIQAKSAEIGISLDGIQVVNPKDSPKRDEYAHTLHEMRKHKGMSYWDARTMLEDEQYYAVLMLKEGDADGEVSGAVHSTADTVRPALQVLKTQPGVSTVSSSFLMVIPDCEYCPDGILVYADCALVIDPSAEQLVEIAYSTSQTARDLADLEPKVAMLSFSTKGSAKHEFAAKVAQAAALFGEKYPDIECDGELQVDAALVPWIGEAKAPQSRVAGRANVLIFPDIQAGNIAYKLTQRLAGAQAIGPILQGVAKPVNDLSRGCSAEDIVNVTAITAVQAASRNAD